MARTGKKKIRKVGKNGGPPPLPPSRVWRPGVDKIEENEELQCDPSAYDCLHAFQLGWPSLSFDIVRDAFGALRHEFPHSLFCVAGSQADVASKNSISVVKLSNITGKKRKPKEGNAGEVSDSDSDESSDDEAEENAEGDGSEGNKGAPVLHQQSVAHHGCVNRIRSMQQQPHIVASWSDTGCVQIWDLGTQSRALSSETGATSSGVIHQAPIESFRGHEDEGYAIDWSPVTLGRLVTGDCKSTIRLWEPTNGGRWNVDATPFLGHSSSVEDLQWSPTNSDIFASCSVDGSIAIWDTRNRQQNISMKAHEADVNVISWNRLFNFLLASGCDDGTFRIWDIRSFKEDSYVAHFKYHNSPVTSIEWSPHESSTLALTSSENQLTIWDLSLERDPEEEAEYQMGRQQAQAPEDLPPQLLFVHQGQKDLKELHWHPQIQGLIVSTAVDGFNVFKPSNI